MWVTGWYEPSRGRAEVADAGVETLLAPAAAATACVSAGAGSAGAGRANAALAAPETPATKHLIGAGQIARMKRGAKLINVGRGSLLDEAAVITALETGALGGAALDVTETEPLPPQSPLWKAPNLLITPHTSAVSDRLWKRETALLMDLLERWFEGRELLNRVDFSRGY